MWENGWEIEKKLRNWKWSLRVPFDFPRFSQLSDGRNKKNSE
jgi:hypothetical protein